ncbi:hypothetical protein PA10_00015 [Pseudomonas phage pPa_SNUABM_DT01]|nr:hypothetical protein PA10_00015 [Pseudomonas phage pPa_SNUABM_DT01]
MAKKKLRAPARVNAYEHYMRGRDLCDTSVEITQGNGHKAWVPARFMGYDTILERIKLTWAVFTGRADALFWPGQED